MALCGSREDAETWCRRPSRASLPSRASCAARTISATSCGPCATCSSASAAPSRGARARRPCPTRRCSRSAVPRPTRWRRTRREVYAAVAALPDDFRDVIVAVDVAGLSYKEAAKAFKTPEGTVMSRLYRARSRWRRRSRGRRRPACARIRRRAGMAQPGRAMAFQATDGGSTPSPAPLEPAERPVDVEAGAVTSPCSGRGRPPRRRSRPGRRGARPGSPPPSRPASRRAPPPARVVGPGLDAVDGHPVAGDLGGEHLEEAGDRRAGGRRGDEVPDRLARPSEVIATTRPTRARASTERRPGTSRPSTGS